MRIIGGSHRGREIKVDKGLPVRPTTAFATESLFNILWNRFNFEEISVLDLFSGTGHISFEFASRGTKQIDSVDINYKCVQFQNKIKTQYNWPIHVIKSDVFNFISNNNGSKYDIVFADPPFDIEKYEDLHNNIFKNNFLNDNGFLIIEHGPRTKLENLPYFSEHRRYGNVNFSFFTLNK
ncbi:MAG: RsmD family RNA methyltransferase [Bacteroidia bacterium]